MRNGVNAQPEEVSPRGADTVSLYCATLSAPGTSWEELRTTLGLSPESFDRAAGELLALGLLEHSSITGDRRLYAAGPASALLRISRTLQSTLAEGQQQLGRLTSVLSALGPGPRQGTGGEGPVERLVSLESVQRTITELSAQARQEVLTSQPGGPRPQEQLQESRSRTEEMLGRGIAMRTLYQRSAQFSPVTVDFVRFVTALGAQVHTVDDAFMRLLVFDRETALISLRDDTDGALLVRDPHVVHFAVQAYERAWSESRPFPARYERQQVVEGSDAVKQSIMRLLVEGLEVGVIARRLGISQRTCQRHISELLHRLGARNRLQAGYLIGRLGLLDGDPSPADGVLAE
ncbi:LuxR C-terminal-related transcriptional regulator [Streptomyces sp. NPDC049954]|uniref:helix-turn-helix transcriptional regulator n=1 Tax=Streptomyces sp. NPDC049954 TaxID=3155779 RepID=UPI003437ED2D